MASLTMASHNGDVDMASQMSIRGFLIRAKDALQRGIAARSRLTFVIGNESADLDSLTSSLLYSYVRTLSAATRGHETLHIPVANLLAADIKLRPELVALLPHAGLEPAHLITLDDLPMDQLESRLPPANTRWVLVDHNAFQGSLGRVYGMRVVGVIDHHDEEHQVPVDTGAEPRVVTKAGSCTSLVVEHVKQQWQALQQYQAKAGVSKDDVSLWNGQAAKLALASILVDTANLKDSNKTTDHDNAAVAYLNSMVDAAGNTGFYEKLQSAKQDIDALSLSDILRKDFKAWDCKTVHLGIASTVKPLEFLREKALDRESQSAQDHAQIHDSSWSPVLDIAEQFARSRQIDLLVVMTASTAPSGGFQREILALALSDAAVQALREFEKAAGDEMKLVPKANNDTDQLDRQEHVRIWQQEAVQHSRKRVAPLFRQAIEQRSPGSQL